MTTATTYIAAARHLHHLANRIEQCAGAKTPRELQALTRAIHAASQHAKRLADKHRGYAS